MARFKIHSKDGSAVRFEGKPRYIGSYLKPSYLEFSEIASPTPIAWEVGDYVDYPRTGMRYYLYSIPQPSKNARKGSHGRAFTYSNVQLHAATKELEIALFRDLTPNDNGIHFSTSPDVATFENVYGIARRIQACMDDFYPNRWEIRVADFDADSDAEVVEKISEAKDFALSEGTCLDALSKIYELWQDIGWIHTYEDGKEVIIIGYANRRIAENTTDPYVYGKGNGLTAIRKNQTNKDEFATRLYIYGSERNLPSRYYNGLNILNAESVDIRNLMLPLGRWGQTNGLPDARKAYLENADAVAKYGIIPKVHYFDSTDAGADIYPSIEGMTIGQIRKGLTDLQQAQYYPSTSIYPDDSERVDMVLSAVNPDDNGVIKTDGKEYDEVADMEMNISQTSVDIPAQSTDEVEVFYSPRILVDVTFARRGMGKISIDPKMNFVFLGEGIESIRAKFELIDADGIESSTKEVAAKTLEGSETTWSLAIPRMQLKCDAKDYDRFQALLLMQVWITPKASSQRQVTLVPPSNPLQFRFNRILAKEFTISLKQIGFDIDKQASLGEGKVISMKTGACSGRDFVISSCEYDSVAETWALTCRRQQDDTLGMLFPYNEYPISQGDEFVLLDIAMPELYIRAGMEDLFSEGQKLLARASRIMSHYEPSIDAKVMIESGRTLREGMFMEITDEDVVDNTTDYILIDTLSIYEDESAIPTYKVTLRERRKVTYKGTPSATSSTNTRSAGDDADEEVEIDLSDYATSSDLASAKQEIAVVDSKQDNRLSALESIWKIDEKTGEIYTTRQVRVDNNVIATGEVSAGGAGEVGEDEEGETTGEYKMYHHKQTEPSTTWNIVHGLGKFPNVKIIDSLRQLCYGDVIYEDTNTVLVKFTAAESGDAYLD